MDMFRRLMEYFFRGQKQTYKAVQEGSFSRNQLEEQIRIIIDVEGIDERKYIALACAYYTYIKDLENKGYKIWAIKENNWGTTSVTAGTNNITLRMEGK